MNGFGKSVSAAYIVVFSALAIALTFSRAEIPYPLLPYLKFDFAEVPVVIALMLGGLIPGLVTEVIHWIGLSLARGWVLGPLMKFLAVIPMVVGFWLGMRIHERRWTVKSMVTSMLLGIVFRAAVCSVLSVAVLLFVAPEFLQFSEYSLKAVGINVASTYDVLFWTLTLNGIFNALHVIISTGIAIMLFRAAAKRLSSVAKNAWVSLEAK